MPQNDLGRTSFIQRWITGTNNSKSSPAADTTTTAPPEGSDALSKMSSQEFMEHMATIAEKGDGSSSNFLNGESNHSATSSVWKTASTHSEKTVPLANRTVTRPNHNHKDAMSLVQELTTRVGQDDVDEEAVFTLTAREIRMLLDQIENKNGEASQKLTNDMSAVMDSSHNSFASATEAVPPPPTNIMEPKETSDLFSMWDFTSNVELSPDEIQAVMIALAAENEHRDDEEEDDETNVTPRPPPLSAREVSIQPLQRDNSNDATGGSSSSMEYLITLGRGRSGRRASAVKRPSGLATRQLTIQSTTTDDEGQQQTKRPSQIAGRQVSVRPVQADEEGALQDSTQFVVTFSDSDNTSASSSGSDIGPDLAAAAAIPPRPLSAFSYMTRQVSIQPTPFSVTEENGPLKFDGSRGNPFAHDRQVSIQSFPDKSGGGGGTTTAAPSRPNYLSDRQVSVRVNGNPNPVSFRVVF